MQSSRKQIRRHLRQRRTALPEDTRKHAAHTAMHCVSRLPWFRKAKRIALYYPVGVELDVTTLLGTPALRGKRLYLPVLAPGPKPYLLFAPWRSDTRWRCNRYGIAEPLAHRGALLRPAQLDLVITPLLGFDAACNRMGAGGGYYDRSFAYRRTRAPWRQPRLAGVAYECQRLPQIPMQPWDVPLDAVVTEQQVYWRRNYCDNQGTPCATG